MAAAMPGTGGPLHAGVGRYTARMHDHEIPRAPDVGSRSPR